ncbi:hypothetical protein RCL_jg2869.t1 [Rhizophagus clarus]|uniref:Uncharacterized protein n=1 Tax=Rhizophagus clarus TaxID=94130 RepID=A0A8H3MBG6_9GLOM|nr:hypothetical protein RCL_jg2869.t1 [Rhizophagus clarus]
MKNYISKLILFNLDNPQDPIIGTPAKKINFNIDSFNLEYYNIILSSNGLEILRCEVDFTNTSIIYTGQKTTSTVSGTCYIPIDYNNYTSILLHQPRQLSSLTIDKSIILPSFQTIRPFNSDHFFNQFECNSKAEELFIIQQHLKHLIDLSFYTDRSLINANSTQISMTVDFLVVSASNVITHSFIILLENWPSSL